MGFQPAGYGDGLIARNFTDKSAFTFGSFGADSVNAKRRTTTRRRFIVPRSRKLGRKRRPVIKRPKTLRFKRMPPCGVLLIRKIQTDLPRIIMKSYIPKTGVSGDVTMPSGRFKRLALFVAGVDAFHQTPTGRGAKIAL